MATGSVSPILDGTLSLPASTRSGDQFEPLRFPCRYFKYEVTSGDRKSTPWSPRKTAH